MLQDSSSFPRRYLISLGTAHYQSEVVEDLDTVEHDLERIDELFIQRLGYRRADLGINGLDPAETDLRRTVGEWFGSEDREPEDLVVFYYSGHGGYYPSGAHYICTPEYDPRNPAADGAILTSTLSNLFFSPPRHPQNVLLILDTCYSGQGAADLMQTIAQALDTFPSDQAGLIVVTAARFHDEADESVFSTNFSELLGELGQQHTSLPYIPVGLIIEAINKRATTQKATESKLGSCRDHFLPNRHHLPDVAPTGVNEASSQEPRALQAKSLAVPAAFEDAADWFFTAYTSIFVGRVEEMNQLRSLLRASKPGYLMIRGIGGVGKSALLVNFIHQFKTRATEPDGAVVLYHFIREGQTDLRRLLQSLNAQLLNCLGEEGLPASGIAQAEKQFHSLWRRLMARAGPETPVLLVLDGLDELDDPGSLVQYLPSELADFTHVVVGVRSGVDLDEYLPREGHIAKWARSMALSNITSDKVEEILNEVLRDPSQASRLVRQVMALTGGFPAAVRLLAKEVADGGEAALGLEPRISARIEKYFEMEARRLIDVARDPLQRRVIALLSVADGPLTSAELGTVLGLEDPQAVALALRPILRSLTSPTSLEFMHLELKRAVAGCLAKDEKDFARRRLANWVRSFAGSKGPASVPDYVLDHFVGQMLKEGSQSALSMTVLSPRWYAAREAQSGSYLDYAYDIARLRDCGDGAAQNWSVFCQSCYLLAQLRSVATGIPFPLIELLARLGKLDQAESFAFLDSNHAYRSWLLKWLADFYANRRNTRKAREMLQRAETALKDAIPPDKLCLLLAGLAASFRALDELAKAKELAGSCRKTVRLVQEDWKKRRAVRSAIRASVVADDFDEALELAETQRGEYSYDDLYVPLTLPLAAKGQIARLIGSLSRGTNAVWWQDDAFDKVVRVLAEHRHVAQAKEVARASSDPDDSLAEVCLGLAMGGHGEECVATFNEIGLREEQELVHLLPRTGKLLYRWRVTRPWVLGRISPEARYSVLADLHRRNALKKILRHLRWGSDRGEAIALARRLETAAAISPGLHNVRVGALLVPWLVERGATGEAVTVAQRLTEEALAIGVWRTQAEARCIASEALGEAHRWEQALDVVEPVLASTEITEDYTIEAARGRSCHALARLGRYDEALRLMEESQSPSEHALRLSQVVSLLLTHGEEIRGKNAARRVLDLASQVSSEEAKAETYTAVAYTYAEFGLTRHALEAVRAIVDTSGRDAALDVVTYLLAQSGTVEGAQDAACAISDYSKRQSRLTSLTRILLRNGDYAEALATVAKIDGDNRRAQMLGECASNILAQSSTFERDRWIKRFLREARGFRDFSQREAFGRIGLAVLAAGERDRAEAIADEALEAAHATEAFGSKVYIGLANACAADGAAEAALAIIPPEVMENLEVTVEVIRLLASIGRWQEAGAMVDRLSGLTRANLLADLAEAAAKLGQKERANQYEAQLQQQAEALTNREAPLAVAGRARIRLLMGDRSGAEELARSAHERVEQIGGKKDLEQLSTPLARAGQKSLALACLSGDDAGWWETQIAEGLAEAGELQDAIDMVQSLLARLEVEEKDSPLDEWVRRECVKVLAKAGQPDLALKTVLAIPDVNFRVRGLLDIARSYQRAGQSADVNSTLRQAYDVLNDPSATLDATTRAAFAVVLGEIGQSEWARAELTEALRQAEARGAEKFIDALLAGAPVLAAIDQGQTLLNVARSLESSTTITRRTREPYARSAA